MLKFISAVSLLFVMSNLFAQTKIVNEKINQNKYILEFETHLDYEIINRDGKDIFRVDGYNDVANPGTVKLPENDLFISLPVYSNPKVEFLILDNKNINAVPEFNSKVEIVDNNKLVYSQADEFKNTKQWRYKVQGYLWDEDYYCLHLKVNPALYKNNSIDLIKRFKVILTFDKTIEHSQNVQTTANNVIDNSGFPISIKEKFQIENSDSWIDYNKSYMKIGVGRDGIYRITKTDLEKYNISTTSIIPRTVKLFLKGEEIPIFVQSDSPDTFGDNDYIEFFGIRNMGGKHRELSGFNEPYNEYLGRYTDTTVYWLTWGGNDGKRVTLYEANSNSSLDTLDYYSQIDHYETNNWFDFSCADIVRRESPFWIENKTWVGGGFNVGVSNRSFTVDNLVKNQKAYAFTKFMDIASNISTNAHLVALSINNDANNYDSTFVDKYEKVVLKAEFNSNLLNNGSNTLKIHSFATDALINKCSFDWYEIEYPRYLISKDDSLQFLFDFINNDELKNIQISNLNSNKQILWRYGNKTKKYNISNVSNTLVFADTINNKDKFIIVDENKITSPKIYYYKKFKNLRSSENSADYIAITHDKFYNQVINYVDFIKQEYNLNTITVNIYDIYDEYSYGFFNPEAIRDFLKSTHNYWQDPKPNYVVLIGGATYDYYGNKAKNLGFDSVFNYVPSYGASVSDTWFITWDSTGAYLPQMNIGRIPVTTNEELSWYFEKHQKYVSQDFDSWNKRSIFFSGGNEANQSELDLLNQTNTYIIDNYVKPKPMGGLYNHFYKTISPATNFGPYSEEYFNKVIDQGSVFIAYLGHSGTTTWDNTIISPSQLINKVDRYPIVTDFGCSTGRFAEPDVVSFSQSFTLQEGEQAIGYIGNASLGFVSTSVTVPKLFYEKILSKQIHRVSEAHKEAKIELIKNYGSSSVNNLFTLTNTFIGDPLISLPIPTKPNLKIDNNDLLLDNELISDIVDSVSVKVLLNNFGLVLDDSVTIQIMQDYNGVIDTAFRSVPMPFSQDTILVKLPIKNHPGIHKVSIVVDPNNTIDEIYENDNNAQLSINVASSAIRSFLQYNLNSGTGDKLKFINPTSNTDKDSIILSLSQNNDFSQPNTYIIPMDTVISRFSTLSLEEDTRYWGKLSISEGVNSSLPFTFYKTPYKFYLSDSLSSSTSVMRGVFADSKDKITIDSSKVLFEVLSSGYFDANTAYIKMNGINYLYNGTLRGHYVTLFKDSTYEFISSNLFDLPGGGESVQQQYEKFLDTLSSNIIAVFAIKDNGGSGLTDNIISKIQGFGSKYIDQVGAWDSWAFIGKKGSAIGSMPEAYSKSREGTVTIDTTITYLADSGSMLTTEIGTAGKWKQLKVDQETPSNSEITYTPIGIRESGSLDTLTQLSINDSTADLSFLDASVYPKMKILAEFKASDDKQSPVLKSLGVDYDLVPELAINYQVVSTSTDSIWQGNPIDLNFDVYNVGESNADSFNVIVNLVKPDNSKKSLSDTLVTRIDSMGKSSFHVNYPTNFTDGFGDMAFEIKIDTSNAVSELFEDNNYYQQPFYVIEDTITNVTAAEVSVLFDGSQVFDGSYINPNPRISTYLDYQPLYQYDDTTQIKFYIDGERYYLSQMDSVRYDTVVKRISYIFSPQLEDGNHSLKIEGTDIFNSGNSTEGYFVNFMVSSELKLLDVYNYPNPVTNETHFTCKLTQIPDEMSIKIYTIAGRLIKEFNINPNDLSLDFNRIYWDTRDEDGDLVANGVYLYKVIVKNKDKTLSQTQKLAIVR